MPEIRDASFRRTEFLRQLIGQVEAASSGRRTGLAAGAEVTEKLGWYPGWYRIKYLAEDQAIIDVVRGHKVETYYGLRKSSGEDAQSDSAETDAREVDWLPIAELLVAKARAKLRTWQIEAVLSDYGEVDEVGHSEGETVWAADQLVRQILELDPDHDRHQLREAIVRAEKVGFAPEDSARVAPRLLELAVYYRDSSDPEDRPVVWSAIRTGASMLRPEDAVRLLPLLEPGHPIETSTVTVKMIGRLFEAHPPADSNRFGDVEHELERITDSLLNRYAIAIPQSAAMAQLAVYALAAVGSSSTDALALRIRELAAGWFTHRTIYKLHELQEHWHRRAVEVPPAHRRLVERALEALQC
jgi:hypothetical protein